MSSVIRGSDNFDSLYGSALKAWVNFNGTGTVAIRASLNVSSITDNGTGDYTVNFASAMPDINYCPTFGGKLDEGGGNAAFIGIARTSGSMAVGSLRVVSANTAATLADYHTFAVSIFR